MSGLSWFVDRIRTFLPELPISAEQFASLHRHFVLLSRWNERMDLTSVDTAEEIVERHYCESLFFASELPDAGTPLTVLDLGSGAGFPGYPIAVLRPHWTVTLLEANQRRAVFLKETSRELPNVRVWAGRSEDYAAKHDLVVARAVKSSEVMACIPRVANRAGLLVSERQLPELKTGTQCRWGLPVHIPWSETRCCAFAEWRV